MKSHIQNGTNHFFWDNVIARSHIQAGNSDAQMH